jgi:hypothetical protein
MLGILFLIIIVFIFCPPRSLITSTFTGWDG